MLSENRDNLNPCKPLDNPLEADNERLPGHGVMMLAMSPDSTRGLCRSWADSVNEL